MKKVFGRIFVLWIPFVALIWLVTSLIFYILTTSAGGVLPENITVIKSMLNWILGIGALLSIILVPVGIAMLSSSSKSWEYIAYGRKLAKKNFGQYWLPLIVILIIAGGLGGVSSTFWTIYGVWWEETLNSIGRTTIILGWIFGLFYGIGLIKLWLQAGDEEKKFSVKTLLVHKWSEIWKSVVAPFVFGFLMAIPFIIIGIVSFAIFAGSKFTTSNGVAGLQEVSSSLGILSIFWGIVALVAVFYLIYVGMRVGMVLKYVAIDHNDLGIWEMIKHSRNITKGKVWKIFVVGFLAGLTNILGFLTLGIGLLWTIPLTLIATAKVYQDIDKEYKKKEMLEVM